MPLFRSSPKSPQELVKALRDSLHVLSISEGGARKADKVCDHLPILLVIPTLPTSHHPHPPHISSSPPSSRLVSPTLHLQAADEAGKHLISMKTMLYGTDTQEPQTELSAQLAQEFYNHDMLFHLVKNLHKLEFEVG